MLGAVLSFGHAMADEMDTSSTSTENNNAGITTTQTETRAYGHDNDRALQLGADYVVPYQIQGGPHERTNSLIGGHAELFVLPAWSFGVQGAVGLEDSKNTGNQPIYLTPSMNFYGAPGHFIEPYVHTGVSFLVNKGQDYGVQGGLGFLVNTGILGLGLRYSFDGTYYFQDSGHTSLNLANVAAVFNW